MKKSAGVFLLVFISSLGCFAQAPLYDVLVNNAAFPAIFKNPELLIRFVIENQADKWNHVDQPQLGSAEENPLNNPVPLVADEFPWLSEAAIADYREAVKRDFMAKVNRPDGWLTMNGLQSLAMQNRLPGFLSASDYMAAHDRNNDNRLTMEEFAPSAEEIARNVNLHKLVSNFSKGLPYETGQMPVASATDFGITAFNESLFTTPEEIEERIVAYASRIGGSTYRRPDGRLGAKDSSGRPIDPLPRDIIPLRKMEAENILQEFADQKGYSIEFKPDRMAIIRDGSGREVGPEKWPPFTQPPYHPQD